MGGHFDAVGFGDPTLGFEATREHLRAAVQEGRRLGQAGEFVYYELETTDGFGLVAATDEAGFLLNGCPYFRSRRTNRVLVEALTPWDAAEPYQGGARALLAGPAEEEGARLTFALPGFALDAGSERLGQRPVRLAGLGYRATTFASERLLPNDGLPEQFFTPVGPNRHLPAIRRCNVECRGEIKMAEFLTNGLTGARLAWALLDCAEAQLEVVIDVPSLSGGLAEGAYLEGSFWMVGRFEPE